MVQPLFIERFLGAKHLTYTVFNPHRLVRHANLGISPRLHGETEAQEVR